MVEVEFEQSVPMWAGCRPGILNESRHRGAPLTRIEHTMNLFKGIKDMAAMVNAAPDMINSANEMAANAQGQQAYWEAQAAEAQATAAKANADAMAAYAASTKAAE
jgi:t-SNARE complex subunit (syntaxin)